MTNRRKPAETYTHTHTHTHTCNLLLSPKQIGTICFAIFSFIFSAPSFADPDIPSSASTANCRNNPLQTYSGTSNLQANWQANTIQLHWYNGDTEIQNVPSESQSCVYDGTLTPPATIPTKTGYTFKGWRVRQAGTSCFASQVCSLTGSAVNGLTYDDSSTAFGYYGNDGQTKLNESTYGLTAGEWAVKDTSGGIIKGIASCNSTMPTIMETMMTAVGNGTMTEEQAIAAVWGSCESDAIKPGNTFSSSSSGQYCWCKMSSYTPSGGSVCNVASPSWVFYNGFGSASGCAGYCGYQCTGFVVSFPDFRRAVFGVQ